MVGIRALISRVQAGAGWVRREVSMICGDRRAPPSMDMQKGRGSRHDPLIQTIGYNQKAAPTEKTTVLSAPNSSRRRGPPTNAR